MTDPASEAFLTEARGGNQAALDRLLESLWPDAYRIAFGVLRNAPLAQDAAQDACATICNAISNLRDADAFRPWFYRIAVRAATHIAKKERRQLSLMETDPRTSTGTDDSLDMQKALATLSLPLRTTVILHYYCGLNSREIASVLEIPSPTVRFRLSVAKQRLRPLLATRLDSQPSLENTKKAVI